jgi:poly(A) polymerase
MLLGGRAYDYDVATNAVPEVVSSLFKRTLTVGAQFGVVVVLMNSRQIEVATFRSDLSYQDGRRPEGVVFTDARHDAERRDFTINGMFLDPCSGEIVDYVGGRADLENRIVRAIGVADERFAEDHLRMLRALRFASRLGFEIEKDTWRAICQHADKIKDISAERIAAELERIIVDQHRDSGLKMLFESGLLQIILPMVKTEQLSLGMAVVGELPKRCEYDLALGALLVDCDARQLSEVFGRLKSSSSLSKAVKWLVGNRQLLLDAIPMSKGQLKKWLAAHLFESLMQLNRAFLRVTGGSEAKLDQLRKQINELDEPVSPAHLLDGNDLIRLGVKAGPMVGQAAEELYMAQLENEVGSVEAAEEWVKRWVIKHKF